MRTLLLLDFSNLVFRVTSVNKTVFHGDRFSGGLLGFFKQLSSLLYRFEPTDILVCKDNPPYLRSQHYTAYKEGRKSPVTDLVKESKPYCEQFLETIGVPSWGVDGLEADDLIALAVENLTDYDRYIIISNDSDLYQLLEFPDVFIYKKGGLYGNKKFKEEFPGINPSHWVLVNALTGGHNGAKGIKGVGIKTALKIVKAQKENKKILQENKDLLRLNKYLGMVPFPDIPEDTEIQPPSPQKYNERNLIKFLYSFGINIRGAELAAFEHLK